MTYYLIEYPEVTIRRSLDPKCCRRGGMGRGGTLGDVGAIPIRASHRPTKIRSGEEIINLGSFLA
jgi:hypothetical protein